MFPIFKEVTLKAANCFTSQSQIVMSCPLCALNTKRRRLDQMERHLRVSIEDGQAGSDSGAVVASEAPTMIKSAPPTLHPITDNTLKPENRPKKPSRSCTPQPYTVPIRATMTKAETKKLKKPVLISPEAKAERQRRAELFEQTLARITANIKGEEQTVAVESKKPSIFQSVAMLAESG
uniref:Uncharacterized protein n=1 Tax=Panagrellus redivivus TaxID=6233 RepID=A0A7E4V0L4_PANRE